MAPNVALPMLRIRVRDVAADGDVYAASALADWEAHVTGHHTNAGARGIVRGPLASSGD